MAGRTERERHRRAMELFERTCELEESARRELLDAECAQDPDLRAQVESLLAADAVEPATLRSPMLADTASRMARELAERAPAAGEETMPARVASYRILGLLGRGGMSLVYEAEQDAPRRRVALKMLRAGFITREEQARFLREVQVLGRLDHPGVARVFDAGVLEASGPGEEPRPWFAMELVEGLQLFEHAVAAGLDWRARCRLLAEVCDAVHHAHVKGVIHRDLKPANILVGLDRRPKVLDFGVASAADELVAGKPMTRQGVLLGTLQYMAPEQARGDAAAADVRSDLYSLGLIAYELLSGRPARDLGDQSIASATRTVLDAPAPRLGQVVPHLRGDPDAVLSKATHEDPERRYQSAEAFALDLRALASEDPVSAVKPTAWDDFRRLVRRRSEVFAVAFIGIVALTLLTVFAMSMAYQAERARADEARQRAVAERLSAEAARTREQAEADAARASLAAAQLALETGDIGMLRRRLDAVPQARRGWSWRHLHARSDDSLLSWPGDGKRARRLRFDAEAGVASWLHAPTMGGETAYVLWDVTARQELVRHDFRGWDGRVRIPLRAGPLFLKRHWMPPGLGELEIRDLSGTKLVGRSVRCEGAERGSLSRLIDGVRIVSDVSGWVTCDSESGEILARAPRGEAREMRVDPRGRFAFLLFKGGIVEVLALPELRPVATLRGHAEDLLDIASSPDGGTVITASRDGTMRWWSLPDGKETAMFAPHRGSISALAYSPCGSLVASSGDDGTVLIWHASHRRTLAVLLGHSAGPNSLAFSEDGSRLLSVGRDGGRLWWVGDDADSRSWRGHESYVYDAALSPDGNRLASSSWDGQVLVRSTRDGGIQLRLQAAEAPNEYPLSVAWSGDGRTLVSAAKRVVGAHWESLLQVWDSETGECLARLELGGGHPLDLGFDEDDRFVLAGCGGRWAAIGTSTWKSVGSVIVESDGLGFLAERDHEHDLSWCRADQPLGGPTLAGGDRLLRSALQTPGFANSVAVSPAGTEIAVGNMEQVAVHDAETGELLRGRLFLGRLIYALAWDSLGKNLFVGSDDSLLRVLHPKTLEVVLTLDGHANYIKSLALDQRTDAIFSASGDSRLRVWDDRRVAEMHGMQEEAVPARSGH